MIDLTLDMEQYDCPFIDTTDDHAVSFSTLQWEFDRHSRELETRMIVEGENRSVLESGLSAVQEHPNMRTCDLFKKREERAVIRTVIDETDAMATIRANGGYITGPFHIQDGSERWDIGFDEEADADAALAELERNNEYSLESRQVMAFDAGGDVLEHAEAARELLEGCRELSTVERETLRVAAEKGYFDQPRGATLQMLANEFDISDTAVSKNVRRAERKILRRVVDALESVE
ncbi:helix-turn-helix domain-containing protein [Halobiforma lacisalsi AJ5]|uniref:Bacterio-opsin activator HTH domain-containing protein n=1 Tax=Natronobacterium lacisalsi AJ5 TaxID=358396 RepID=M0LCD7_NATLA|nr:helix-turn-helix domain-containing protein [Halobiforma lacisalsi]APW99112.1 helix-turn-helix domain-containing protein [Halobiforma lacisalsi AJ5]EMA31232.1 Bacterio-opsin activator HTH domain-containing protein [Halobiforma lacisalsi AJ5]